MAFRLLHDLGQIVIVDDGMRWRGCGSWIGRRGLFFFLANRPGDVAQRNRGIFRLAPRRCHSKKSTSRRDQKAAGSRSTGSRPEHPTTSYLAQGPRFGHSNTVLWPGSDDGRRRVDGRQAHATYMEIVASLGRVKTNVGARTLAGRNKRAPVEKWRTTGQAPSTFSGVTGDRMYGNAKQDLPPADV